MRDLLVVIWAVVLSLTAQRRQLLLENLALRQQLAVFKRTCPRPRLRATDKVFWLTLSRLWPDWKGALCVVKPATVIAWHRAGFRLFWRWRSKCTEGRPGKSDEVVALIQRLADENRHWGAPRIHGELIKLGIRVALSTVQKYLPKRRGGPGGPRRPASQSWRTFLKNHLHHSAAIDFFVVPTVTFRLLYGFVVLQHGRREIRHVGVTHYPTAEWTAQQLKEAFAFDTAPAFLHRDRDGIFGRAVTRAIAAMGIEDRPSAPRSPWQNPYCERVIGTLRRELFQHVVVLNERHAQRLLREYGKYYNESRTHLSLAQDSPHGRPVELRNKGPVHAEKVLGGLHHRYFRRAA